MVAARVAVAPGGGVAQPPRPQIDTVTQAQIAGCRDATLMMCLAARQTVISKCRRDTIVPLRLRHVATAAVFHRRLRQAEKKTLLVEIIRGSCCRNKILEVRERFSLLQPGECRNGPYIYAKRFQQRYAKNGLQVAFLIDEGDLLMPLLASVNLQRHEPGTWHLPALFREIVQIRRFLFGRGKLQRGGIKVILGHPRAAEAKQQHRKRRVTKQAKRHGLKEAGCGWR